MLSTSDLVEAIRRDGYVVVPDLITRREIGEIKASLAPWLRGQLMGRNDFEGFRTERVYALLAKAPPVARIIEHPDRIGGILSELAVTPPPARIEGNAALIKKHFASDRFEDILAE